MIEGTFWPQRKVSSNVADINERKSGIIRKCEKEKSKREQQWLPESPRGVGHGIEAHSGIGYVLGAQRKSAGMPGATQSGLGVAVELEPGEGGCSGG